MKVSITKMFIAQLEDIGASGETEAEALENLVDVIEAKYSLYTSMETHLGPGPARQLETLRKLNFDINGDLISKLEVG